MIIYLTMNPHDMPQEGSIEKYILKSFHKREYKY